MKKFLALAIVLLCGCDAFQPQYEPEETDDWFVQPKESVRVVLVSEPWCAACQEQKPILQKLVDDGLISGFDVVNSKHPEYKARVLPTLYVCCDHGCRKLEGLSTEQDILRAAQE